MLNLIFLRKEIHLLADPERAKNAARYFKSGKGEYGEGDIFIGLTVPQVRELAKKYKTLPLDDVLTLLKSAFHEERLLALFILINTYQHGDQRIKKKIIDSYLDHISYVNNWDLVDSSADKLLGNYLFDKPRALLYEFAHSDDLWKKRIAIMSTFYFIRKGEWNDAFQISAILLQDNHDLIHKAVGWMLREVGLLISKEKEEEFLREHYASMPRTMLRYAIEKFPEVERKKYLRGEV